MAALLPDAIVLLAAWPALTAGYTVFGMVGFGTTLVALPLVAHVLPLSTAVPAVAAIDFLAATGNGVRLGAQVVRREVWRLVPPMFAGSALGAWVLFAVPVRALMLLPAHVGRELVRCQDRLRTFRVQPRGGHRVQQHLRVGNVAGFGEVSAQQGLLQRPLRLGRLLPGPVQQPVCVEGVPDPPAALLPELEADRLAAGPQGLPVGGLLLSGGAVLLAQVLGDVLAFRSHLRIELEGLEVQFGLDVAVQPLQRLLQGSQPDGAPGTGDVGDEIDLEGGHARHAIGSRPTLRRALASHRSVRGVQSGSAAVGLQD